MKDTRITLPGTDIQVSRLGLGTSGLHRALTSRARQAVLNAAVDCGITHFDCARYYGHGLAEAEVGRFARHRRTMLTIATKVGIRAVAAFERMPPLLYVAKGAARLVRPLLDADPFLRRFDMSARSSVAEAEKSVAASLKALSTDYLDLLLLHEPPSQLVIAEEWVLWLTNLKRRGIVRALGLSGEAGSCMEIALRRPDIGEVLQVRDSLNGREADRILETGRPLQITYGYLRAAGFRDSGRVPSERLCACVQRAMQRNVAGLVLFSSIRPNHVKQIASCTLG